MSGTTSMGSKFSQRPGRRLALAIFLGGLTAACGRTDQASADLAPRDEIVVATPSDVPTLDPQNSNDTQSDQVILMVYAGLLRLDDHLRVTPDLAESWTTSPDGKTWTFHLRPGLQFDDGTPLDATTVQRSFARALDPAQPNLCRTLFAMIDRVEVVDARTVRFVNRYPFRAFDRTLAHMAASILNPVFIERFGRQLGRSAAAVSGAGPYRLVSWQRDQEIVLEANRRYWGAQGRDEDHQLPRHRGTDLADGGARVGRCRRQLAVSSDGRETVRRPLGCTPRLDAVDHGPGRDLQLPPVAVHRPARAAGADLRNRSGGDRARACSPVSRRRRPAP